MNNSKYILLIDDHNIIRTGLKEILLKEFSNLRIFEAWDAQSASMLIRYNKFDLIVCDLNFSSSNNPDYFSNKLFPLFGNTPVCILSMLSPEKFANKYLALGVKAYLHKEMPDFLILEAVKELLEKGHYKKTEQLRSVDQTTDNDPFQALSSRELEVAGYIVKGLSLKMIASILDLQVPTVSSHKIRIMEKLGVDSSIELARLFDHYYP
jgi:DNA-binding NarL/FixJ family response regulator